MSGAGRYLKEKNPKIQIIGVDPVGSVFAEYKRSGKFPDIMKTYKVEGVGEDFIPSTIDFRYIDDVIQVHDRECFTTARKLARQEGILVGGSSGMALFAAARVCAKIREGLVVVLFPDSGKSYLSKMYSDDWMRENGFLSSEEYRGTVSDILASKKGKKMISISGRDTVKKAIALMKANDISQMPVVSSGRVVGKVTERQLLTGLYEKRIGPTNHISAAIDPFVLQVPQSESVDRVSELLEKENLVVVVSRAGKPEGVVTRIDLIDYYA